MTNAEKKKELIVKQTYVLLSKYPQNLHDSGIYIYERTDENGIQWFYCGQAVDIYNRILSHAKAYDHLGLSLVKRGYYSKENPYGWKFGVITFCDKSRLDNLEHYYILGNMRLGKQAYNVTAGCQGEGKVTYDTKKVAKGYSEGVRQGYERARREVKHLFDLHLNAVTKALTPSKLQEKALQKFNDFLRGGENE